MTIEKRSFKEFITNRNNFFLLGIFLLIYLIINIWHFDLYGIQFYYEDSHSYIQSAKEGLINGYRPYGYSGFMRFIHYFNTSAHFHYFFLYWLNAVSVLTLLFTVKHLFRISKFTFYLLAFFSILCPTLLNISNLFMSDSLFASLTLLYLSSGIWLIFSKPNKQKIVFLILNCILLYGLISVRYTALFYPILTILIIGFSFWKNKAITFGLAIIPLAILFFSIESTKNEMKETINVETFSGFSGWGLANNTLSMIPSIRDESIIFKNPILNKIHKVVLTFGDEHYIKPIIDATSHMWKDEYPFRKFMLENLLDEKTPYITTWNEMGCLLKEYGKELITLYPTIYVKTYIKSNFNNVFKPFDFPEYNNRPSYTYLKDYFNYKPDTLEYKAPLFYKNLFPLRKITYLIMWSLFFLALLLSTINLFRFKTDLVWSKPNVFLVVFILGFIGFSIVSHPINNYRYFASLYIPMYIFISLTLDRNIRFFKKNLNNPKKNY